MVSIVEGCYVICWHVLLICVVAFSVRLRKWNMWFGFIICYESSTWAFAGTGGRSLLLVLCDFGGRFVDALWDGILEYLLDQFGSISGPFWGDGC